mmetsp:Transcript_60632/g.179779  ORF Transcript_60632/g.179779 Transcript_60632/m.179779 type:complete len:341 (-) Transcript_60632:395-1417(-)
MPRRGRLDPTPRTPPGHDDRVRCDPPLENFVPPDQRPAVRVQKGLDAPDEVALQFSLVGQAVLLDARLASVAPLPPGLATFVPPDVNIFAWEQAHDLRQNVPEEIKGPFVPGAERLLRDAPLLLRGVRSTPRTASQVRVRGQRRLGVPGHVDLGDDVNVPPRGVRHDFPHVVLRVVSAVTPPVVSARIVMVVALHRLVPPGAHFGQSGVLFYFDPPPLILGEVPMERVHLVHRDQVDEIFHEFLRHEMPAAVQVHTAPPEAGTVLDADAGDDPFPLLARCYLGVAEDVLREKLEQRLHSVEEPPRRRRSDVDRPLFHLEQVRFLVCVSSSPRRRQGQPYG